MPRRLLRRGGYGLLGGILLLLFVLAASSAPWITLPPNYQTTEILAGPTGVHWLGTDHLGRDMFARLIWGARTTLTVASLAVAVAVTLGTVVGLASGYIEGLVDVLVQRVVDAMIAFPALVLAMAAIAAFEASFLTISITIGVVTSPGVSRVVRGATMAVRSQEFVGAARSIGASDLRIVIVHILPNVRAPIIVMATILLGGAVLVESSLSFLGFGLPPPDPTWGQMLSGPGRVYMVSQPWLAVLPGLAITLTVLAANLFGDSLRDILDPRT